MFRRARYYDTVGDHYRFHLEYLSSGTIVSVKEYGPDVRLDFDLPEYLHKGEVYGGLEIPVDLIFCHLDWQPTFQTPFDLLGASLVDILSGAYVSKVMAYYAPYLHHADVLAPYYSDDLPSRDGRFFYVPPVPENPEYWRTDNGLAAYAYKYTSPENPAHVYIFDRWRGLYLGPYSEPHVLTVASSGVTEIPMGNWLYDWLEVAEIWYSEQWPDVGLGFPGHHFVSCADMEPEHYATPGGTYHTHSSGWVQRYAGSSGINLVCGVVGTQTVYNWPQGHIIEYNPIPDKRPRSRPGRRNINPVDSSPDLSSILLGAAGRLPYGSECLTDVQGSAFQVFGGYLEL